MDDDGAAEGGVTGDGSPPPTLEDLDLTAERDSANPRTLPGPEEYNRTKSLDEMRGIIALVLLSTTGIVIGLSFLVLATTWVTMDDLKSLLTIVFGPLITLLATALGFYYGRQSD